MKLMNIIFPENIKCISCKEPIPVKNPYSLCKKCYENINKLKIEGYEYDQILLNLKNKTIKNKKILENVFLIYKYDGIIKTQIHLLKYNNATYLSKVFAQMLYEKILEEEINADYILPVPMNDDKKKTRGYNQVDLITKELSALTKIKVIDIVKRVKDTPDMYHLNKKEREESLEGAFFCEKEDELKDKKILIIDDIITTGKTLENLAIEIKKKNINTYIQALVLARPSKK